jgi:hypothetical protein
MSRGASVMDYGGLSELNLEDSNGRPIMTNPSRSRVSSRPLSRYHSEEEDDMVHVSRPRSRRRHSSESSSSLEVNRVDNRDVLPHSAHEFGLSSRSHRRHDSRHPSDYRRGYSSHQQTTMVDPIAMMGDPIVTDSRSYRDDRYRDRSYRDDRAYRDDRRYYRDDDPYYRERSRSRHRSRHHRSSRYHDQMEDHEGRLPVIIMFDNGRGR